MSPRSAEDTLNALVEADGDARRLLAEVRSAAKELRDAIREARALVKGDVQPLIHAELERQLALQEERTAADAARLRQRLEAELLELEALVQRTLARVHVELPEVDREA